MNLLCAVVHVIRHTWQEALEALWFSWLIALAPLAILIVMDFFFGPMDHKRKED